LRHIEKLGGAPKLRTPDAVVFGEKGYVVEAMEYAQTLVREGLTVENSLFNTLDETKAYAKSKGIKKLVVVGSEITELDI
jgi:ATP phosphoribosyltransferase regulatory subunit